MDSKGNGAHFSTDKTCRYHLWRTWDPSLPRAMCIGLNPSTAVATKNDPTIDLLIRVLDRLHFGGLDMVNLFPVISSDPKVLYGVDLNNKENTDNQYVILDVAKDCGEVIFAWGRFRVIHDTGAHRRWLDLFPHAKCFGRNDDGSPMHPMALMYSGTTKTAQLEFYSL